MDELIAQYEAFPYPERDPRDERKRLIVGSPSLPTEIDHYLFGGQRDWTRTLRVLVAGGGSGDGLIQLAQLLCDAGRPYQITYVDLSRQTRAVAEARAKARALEGITFHTGSLLDAPELGQFDYIDCCGVLHHLPNPDAGFAALSAALAPGGGLGLMVYAPYGRSGVYPLQEAFGALFEGLSPQDRLAAARKVIDRVPKGHPFRTNPHLVDHETSDAGFYDLLLHSSDRAFSVRDLTAALERAGLRLASFAEPGHYDLSRYLPPGVNADHLDPVARMEVAERLAGTIKVHVAYAVPAGRDDTVATGRMPGAIPHLRGLPAAKLAQAVAARGAVPMTAAGERQSLTVPKAAAPLIAAIDGRADLARIRGRAGLDTIVFGSLWAKLDVTLRPWGLLHYSTLLAE